MINRLIDYFIPAGMHDSPEEYRHTKINILFYLINATALLINVSSGFQVKFAPFIYINIMYALLSVGLAFMIKKGVSPGICASILATVGIIYVNFVIFNTGGTNSPTIFGLVFVSLYYLFLSNDLKTSIYWMIFSSLNVIAYFIYESINGPIPVKVDTSNLALFDFNVLFAEILTIFILVSIFHKQKDRAVGDLILINENLKKTQAQLIQSEKLASLGELTAGIAHEIQNPLNFVNNFSDLSIELAKELKEEAEKTEIDKDLIFDLINDFIQNQEKINHHGKRASDIVKSMLEHSRKSSGEKVATDINALADEYLRLAFHGLRAKDKSFNADFRTDFDSNLPKMEVIPQDFGRVLLNLINNAFYACAERSRSTVKSVEKPLVVVSTKKIENQVIISVKDNGIGMTEEVKAKIFQPFYTTKPTGQGTGLGLSISYDIVTKGHGGTIEVESKEGEGTEFIISLSI